MNSYEEIEAALWKKLPMGQAHSLPVPTMRGGTLLDLVFINSVDRETRQPNAPHAVIEVDMAAGTSVKIEEPETLRKITFEPIPFEVPERFKEKVAEAKELYGEVREEAAAGEAGPASKRYAELVWSVSQKPLRPYYRALSPALFADCQ
jgi:hypothetical protein